VPHFLPSFVRTPFTQWHVILSENTRDSKLSYAKNQKSLSHLGSDQYRVVTDRHQDRHHDRITVANNTRPRKSDNNLENAIALCIRT